uniref:c-type cytochrome n=1 Tax=Pararhizobium sp. IMCC3301 TaxID=3067904 RepID=UPI0027416D48|nr:cytochrome c family protein [Pararhizobium sp. IMCC3301]
MKKIILAGVLSMLMPFAAYADSHSDGDADSQVEGDAEAGEAIFKKCAACHAVGPDAKNKVGPVLNGVFGREAGTVEGYKYSKAMLAAEKTWDEETLEEFLANPRKALKGTKMAFGGLKKEDDLENVIAYLAQFDEEGNMAE